MMNTRAIQRYTRRAIALAALVSVACPAMAQRSEDSFKAMIGPYALVPQGQHDSDMLAKASVAIEFIKQMELTRAHQAVNEALQLDARNAHLHFLNGFVYHLQAKQGDTQKIEVAIEGYQQALRLDPSHWIAQEFLGLAFMDMKQFDRAKVQFSEVLLMTPDSAVAMYGLMVAAYLTGDAGTACTMADQFRQTNSAPDPGFVRSSIAVYASCAKFDQAEQMRATLVAVSGDGPDVQRVDRRLAQWKAFYQRQGRGAGLTQTSLADGPSASAAPPERLAQAFSIPSFASSGAPSAPTAAPTAAPSAAATVSPPSAADTVAVAPEARAEAAAGPRMVLIDVVLLSTQELVSTSKGINLLSALTLQLGSLSGNVSGYSRVVTSTQDADAPAAVNTAITRAVTVPALSYSLNIANANSSVNEVLARPTLAAIEGLPSEFFSGTNLSAGVVSTSSQGGTTVVPLDKRFGVKLAITPAFLPRGQVQLKVDAQRTSLSNGPENPKVAYQIEIAEIVANANVVMNLGDTLVLSGLSEKSFVNSRDGVPGLQDVPGLQYLFSNKKTTEIQRSVLILVTPRAPVQVAESKAKPGQTMVEDMKVLRERFGLPASLPTNVDAIISQLQPGDLYREFRQGDVSLERWDRMHSTGERLKEALGFLYY